jgi:hypothetical protein
MVSIIKPAVSLRCITAALRDGTALTCAATDFTRRPAIAGFPRRQPDAASLYFGLINKMSIASLVSH